jgi:predicted small lipoprotein YifL
MKKGISIAAILMLTTVFGVTGCGTKTAAAPANNDTTPAQTQTVSDQEKAAAVVKAEMEAAHSFSYKDHSTFDAPGKFMFPDLAADENKYNESFISKYDSQKAYEEHGPVTVTFIKQDGQNFVFDAKVTTTVYADPDKKKLDEFTSDHTITVTKTSDGQFLISEIHVNK